MSITDIRELATILGVIVALITSVKALIEYARQGAQKRLEHFFNLRKKLKEKPEYLRICNLLEEDHDDLKLLDFGTKRDFVGVFEEVAIDLQKMIWNFAQPQSPIFKGLEILKANGNIYIMLNSRQIKERIALYMFGYYAIDCWDSDKFWEGMDRESSYVAVFKDFAQRMKHLNEDKKFRRKDFKI